VTVLEVRPRVGGRVVSFNMVPGKVTEGGGELVGSNHAHWLAYAKELGLTFNEIPEDTNEQLMLEGKVLSKEDGEKLHKEMDAATDTLNEIAKTIDEEQPWQTSGAKAMDAMSMADWMASLQCSALAKKALRAWFEADETVPLEKQSYLAFLAMVKGGGVEKYWTDTETCRCAQGNQALAMKLAAGLDVRLNTEVKSVAYGGSGAIVSYGANGKQIEADDVVLAVPPSVWKKIKFTPALPESLMPQMGVGVKYISAVKARYWRQTAPGRGTDSLSDTDISMTWESTEGQAEAAGIQTPAVLTAFSGGPAAEHFRSRQRADMAGFVQKHMEALLPGFMENRTDNTRFMDWPADPWTMASYAFAAPREITTIGKTLYDGIGHLHFVGEHTSYRFVGYMEGALDSGASLARRIARRDGVKMRAAPKVPEGEPGKKEVVENPGAKVPAATQPSGTMPAATEPAGAR
jgi:monoamine oxidase